jgi:hypothetical protein
MNVSIIVLELFTLLFLDLGSQLPINNHQSNAQFVDLHLFENLEVYV